MTNIMETIKKIFDPHYADKKVEEIVNHRQKVLKDASRTAEKLSKTINQPDVGIVVYIAAGGKK